MRINKLEIERTSLLLCLDCNLRCRDCCLRVKTYQYGYRPDLTFIQAEVAQLFHIVDRINYFSVEGGEPLLCKFLPEVLDLLSVYIDRIGVEVPLITNGTLLPSAKLIAALKRLGNKAHVIIDNYGAELSVQVPEVVTLLKQHDIRYSIKDYTDNLYYGGWVDLYGAFDKKRTREESKLLFSKCAWAQKLQGVGEVIGGLLVFCPPSRLYRERGIDTNDGWLDMFDDSTTLEEKREIVRGWYEKDCFTACMYCNGIHDESERIPPAVQLTPDELKAVKINEYQYREEL